MLEFYPKKRSHQRKKPNVMMGVAGKPLNPEAFVMPCQTYEKVVAHKQVNSFKEVTFVFLFFFFL